LEVVQRKMGFSGAWAERVMARVMSIKFDVLVNGNHVGPITRRRGLS